MEQLKLEGMDRLRPTLEQAQMIGLLKDKEIVQGNTSKQNFEVFKILAGLGIILLSGYLLYRYSLRFDEQSSEEE